MPIRSPGARALTLSLTSVVLIFSPGCGARSDRPETVPVRGKVTYDGQPVTKGTITFQPQDGRPATGEIQPDGSYRLGTFDEGDGAVPGRHKVSIIADDSDPTLMPGSSPGYKPPKELVPKKYNKAETSGLEVEVSKDRGEYDLDLK